MGDGGVVGRFYIIWREERTMHDLVAIMYVINDSRRSRNGERTKS